ncbi:FAD synthase-like, partial [Tropilaelaps mercedesae]
RLLVLPAPSAPLTRSSDGELATVSSSPNIRHRQTVSRHGPVLGMLISIARHCRIYSARSSPSAACMASTVCSKRRLDTSSHARPPDSTDRTRSDARSAGIVIIGDEVLRGDVRDENAYFLVKSLHRYGVEVKRVTFIGDDSEEIGRVVKDFADRFNVVLTCGGVGPTHDDVTYEAIAAAFGERVVLRQDLWEMFKLYFGKHLPDDSPLKKFAQIPENAEPVIAEVVHSSHVFKTSLVALRNVIILPGVPLVTEKLFPVVVKRLGLGEMPENSRDVFLGLDEASVTQQLNEAVARFKEVKFGSYPTLYGNYYKTRLRIEAGSASQLNEVEAFLLGSLPDGTILDKLVGNPLKAAHKRVETLASKYPFVREAYSVIWEALRRYKPHEICVAFSGGKDCTVIAYLYYAALQEYAKENLTDAKQNWLYIRPHSSRPEVETFIEDSVKLYGAQLMTSDGYYKDGLQMAVDSGLRAFLLGNRVIDPKGDTLDHFKETDPDWPHAMRIFPILRWDYGEVWTFIRKLYVPYCPLYDQGFSSLGVTSMPNPQLTYVDERGVTRFKPAYLLADKSAERIGRG